MEVIVTHKNTDFDALASVFAASLIYPDAAPVLPTSQNPNVRQFLSIHKDLFPWSRPGDTAWGRVKKLIVVDTNDWNRLEGAQVLRDSPDIEIHLWDHHLNPATIEAQWEHCMAVGAAATLFARRLEEEGTKISPIQATLFLAGIYEDTGNLSFPSTTAVDAQAAAFLLRRKADLDVINTFLRPAYGPKQKDVLFKMLQNAERTKLNGYTVSINTCSISGHTSGLAIVVEMYRDILNLDAAFGIFMNEKQGRTIIVGRSALENINIGSIMRAMGGGGHPGAGSALLKNHPQDPDRIRAQLIDRIKGTRHSGAQIGDIMSFPVLTVSPRTPMTEAAHILREKGCTGLPVVEGGKVVGIISRRDFRKFRKNTRKDPPVKAFMSTNVTFIEPGQSITKAARLMVKKDIGRLPVIEDEKLIGIITRSDAMRYYYDLLPD